MSKKMDTRCRRSRCDATACSSCMPPNCIVSLTLCHDTLTDCPLLLTSNRVVPLHDCGASYTVVFGPTRAMLVRLAHVSSLSHGPPWECRLRRPASSVGKRSVPCGIATETVGTSNSVCNAYGTALRTYPARVGYAPLTHPMSRGDNERNISSSTGFDGPGIATAHCDCCRPTSKPE
jgi:hypothetical protein